MGLAVLPILYPILRAVLRRVSHAEAAKLQQVVDESARLAEGSDSWDTARPVTLLAGLSGFLGGTVFSTVLGTFYSNRRLGDLSPGRIAIRGAGAGLLVPPALLGIGMAVHVPMQPELVGGVALGRGVFGAVTGGGIIKIAQAGDDEPGPGGGGPRLTSGG